MVGSLDSILMSGRRIFTRPARRRADSHRMDLVALALGLIFFVALVFLLEGLDRI
jgi:hypothetical protein